MTAMDEIARHDVVLATVAGFAERAGAVRVAVLLDRGPEHDAPLIEFEPGQGLSVTSGEQSLIVARDALDGVPPLPVTTPKPVPATAIEVDAEAGEVAAPIGALEALAGAVAELARVLGGRSVAVADFGTRSGEPFSIAARTGEPVVVAIGDHQFELPLP